MSGHIKLIGGRFFDWIAAGKQVYTDTSPGPSASRRAGWPPRSTGAASATTGCCSPATSRGATTPASSPGCAAAAGDGELGRPGLPRQLRPRSTTDAAPRPATTEETRMTATIDRRADRHSSSKSLAEIPHPSLPKGTSIYGGTKVFPDYQAEDGRDLLHPRARHRPRVVGQLRRDPAGHPRAAQGLRVGDLLLRPRLDELPGHPRLPDHRRLRLPRRAEHQRPRSRPSSPRAARSTAAASASRCTAPARRT